MEEELDIHKVIGALECYANDPLCDNDCSKCPYGYALMDILYLVLPITFIMTAIPRKS